MARMGVLTVVVAANQAWLFSYGMLCLSACLPRCPHRVERSAKGRCTKAMRPAGDARLAEVMKEDRYADI
jgi:hypothetical protein